MVVTRSTALLTSFLLESRPLAAFMSFRMLSATLFMFFSSPGCGVARRNSILWETKKNNTLIHHSRYSTLQSILRPHEKCIWLTRRLRWDTLTGLSFLFLCHSISFWHGVYLLHVPQCIALDSSFSSVIDESEEINLSQDMMRSRHTTKHTAFEMCITHGACPNNTHNCGLGHLRASACDRK